jgi:hypothetical protein
VSWLAKMAPKMATPIEPPIWRKRVEPELATPRYFVVDGVLGGEHEHLDDQPEAEPEHEHGGAGHQRRGIDLEP